MNIIPTKTPKIIKILFAKYTWDFYTKKEKKIYLTFDDGPIPEITEFVLDQLKLYNAKATFFCIGDNIKKHPSIFEKIIQENHSIGNHTMNHLKAWKNSNQKYLDNILLCEKSIDTHTNAPTKIFRPPYGQISKSKLRLIKKRGYKIILWDVLSKDWDKKTSPEKCYQNVISNSKSGSIIVFHDSIKASKNLIYTLPKVLNYFSKKGYKFENI